MTRPLGGAASRVRSDPERYIVEGSPRLQHFAEVAASLAKREASERM
jgi:hypothetical protein